MNRWIKFVLASLVFFVPCFSTAQKGPHVQIVLRGGWLFDSVGDERARNTGIVIEGGKFMEVQTDLTGRDLSSAVVIELRDNWTILPGMIDLHAHYGMNLVGLGRVSEINYNPMIYLANGTTTTFSAGEMDPESMREARKRMDSDRWPGPRLLNSGPYFGAARLDWKPDITAEKVREEVDLWAARGVRGFKVKAIGLDHLRALIDQAHLHGLTVTGHLYGHEFKKIVHPRDAILMGMDRIEHCLYEPSEILKDDFSTDDPDFQAMLQLYIKHHVFFDATLSVYGTFGQADDPEVFTDWVDERKFFTPYFQKYLKEHPFAGRPKTYADFYWKKRKTIKAFHDAGGKHLITMGTDHPGWGRYTGGFSAHRELLCFVLAGIPPADVLKFATINGAHAIGVSDRLGTIEPGKFADLFVVEGNPLEDIRNARNVRIVMKSGRIFDPGDLLKKAEGKIGPKDAEDHAAWGRPEPPEVH